MYLAFWLVLPQVGINPNQIELQKFFFFETKRVKEAIDEEANQIIEMHLHAVAAAHSLFGLLLLN